MVLPSSVCVKSSKTARGSSQVLNEPRFLALYGMDKPTLEAGPKQQLSTFLSAHILAGIDLLHDNTCTSSALSTYYNYCYLFRLVRGSAPQACCSVRTRG